MSRADSVIVNGRVWAGVGLPEIEAVAIRGDRIAAVGTSDEMRDYAGNGARVFDARGRRVVPGLIDSHIHMVRAGLTWNQTIDWSGVSTLHEAMEMIRAQVESTPPGTWVSVVGGWGPGQFSEGRGPSVDELTALSDDHPIYVQYLYESAVMNEAALAAIGIDAKASDPDRGWFERTADGTPTGYCMGVGAFQMCLGAAGRPDFETQVEWTAAMMRRLNRCGMTGVIDPGGMGLGPEAYRPLYELWRRREMTIRTRMYMMVQGAGNERAQMADFLKFLHPGFGDEWLRLTGAGEIVSYGFMDLEGVRPFEVTAEGSQLLTDLLIDLFRAGWSVHLHAVMRDTITEMLNAIERAVAIAPADGVRLSLAHAEPITDADLDRVQKLGMGIGIQDRMVFRAKDSAEVWGEEILRRSPPLRGMLDRGIPIGGGTDATVVSPYDPWRSLWWLVTGHTLDGGPPRDPEWNITREEAMHAYTSGSAWFSLDEGSRGRIEPGMLADIAVLNADFFSVAEEEIPTIEADMTMVGGDVVHGDQ